MYQISEKEPTLEYLFKKLKQEEIWERYLGFELPNQGDLFCSPFREEDTPSANLFYASDGKALIKDFGGKCMNCVQYVAFRYKISFVSAINRILKDFDAESREDLPPLPKVERKKPAVIQIQKRKLDQNDLDYWAEYNITEFILDFYNVVPVSYIWVNSHIIPCYSYSYSYEFGQGKRKIYRPKSSIKFCSNLSGQLSGYQQLPPTGDLLIITKSHKDVMSWYSLGYWAISAQSESTSIPEHIMKSLLTRFKKVIVNYDNDRTGKYYSNLIEEQYNLNSLFFVDTKDISDNIKNSGVISTYNYIKECLQPKEKEEEIRAQV